MPYEIKGKTVISKDTGKRRHFRSPAAAKAWVRFNQAREHGFVPTGKGAKK